MSFKGHSLQPCDKEANQLPLHHHCWIIVLDNVQQLRAFEPQKNTPHSFYGDHGAEMARKGSMPEAGWRPRMQGTDQKNQWEPDGAKSSRSVHEKRRCWECHQPQSPAVNISMTSRNQDKGCPWISAKPQRSQTLTWGPAAHSHYQKGM